MQEWAAGIFYYRNSSVCATMTAHVIGKVQRIPGAPVAAAEYDDAEFYDTKANGLVKCPACLGDGDKCQFTCEGCFYRVYKSQAIKDAIQSGCTSRRVARALIYAEFGSKLRTGQAQASTPTPRIERPCKACKRPNDVGVRSCWCCGIERPV